MSNLYDLPYLGFGLGLRSEHYLSIVEEKPDVDWFEIISENYMVPGGKPLYFLDKIRADYPMVMHGVSLSIGSTDEIDQDYLRQLQKLAQRVEPAWISDHLCWTGIHGLNTHDLLPLPYTEETAAHVANRILQVQDFLKRPLLIENVSSYINYIDSSMSESEFLSLICLKTDCKLLLDINNVYVSSFNHQFDAKHFINEIPAKNVQQIHLAGHHHHGDYIIDTHDAQVAAEVWELYGYAIGRFGKISTMIERDDNIPALATLLPELDYAKEIAYKFLVDH